MAPGTWQVVEALSDSLRRQVGEKEKVEVQPKQICPKTKEATRQKIKDFYYRQAWLHLQMHIHLSSLHQLLYMHLLFYMHLQETFI